MPKPWKVGDRITRERYMDDGTWDREGDGCLPGPLKHGVVVEVCEGDVLDVMEGTETTVVMYRVRWDGGGTGAYFGHGIDAEEMN